MKRRKKSIGQEGCSMISLQNGKNTSRAKRSALFQSEQRTKYKYQKWQSIRLSLTKSFISHQKQPAQYDTLLTRPTYLVRKSCSTRRLLLNLTNHSCRTQLINSAALSFFGTFTSGQCRISMYSWPSPKLPRKCQPSAFPSLSQQE